MNILVFQPFYPPHTGGLESHSDEFNHHLSQEGATITVFTPRLPASAPAFETRYDHVHIFRFPAVELIHNYPFPKFWTKDFWRMWHKIRKGEYHIVVSRTRFFFTSLMAWRYARETSLPWVHIEHGSDFASFTNPFKTLLGKFYDHTVGAWVLRHSDVNIANSKASANFVGRLSQRDDCHIIYRGVEKEIIEKISPNTFFQEHFPGKVVIGFVGRLIDGKGVIELLKAFSALAADTSVCAVIGDGPERVRLENFVTHKKLSSRVIFFGEQSFSEAMSLLKAFDIFVNPSYTEGIPTSVIEAALSHKAIIATHVGGTSEIISGTNDGFLIAARDQHNLQEKLSLLVNNTDLRRSMGEQAFLRVGKKFDWTHATREYLTLFHTLLK